MKRPALNCHHIGSRATSDLSIRREPLCLRPGGTQSGEEKPGDGRGGGAGAVHLISGGGAALAPNARLSLEVKLRPRQATRRAQENKQPERRFFSTRAKNTHNIIFFPLHVIIFAFHFFFFSSERLLGISSAALLHVTESEKGILLVVTRQTGSACANK